LNKGWVSNDYILLRTTNSGDNWELQLTSIYGFLSSIDFPTSSVGYIAGDNKLILKTTDAGNSWIQILGEPGGYDLNDVFFVNENVGWICGFSGLIMRTTNGGSNWTTQNLPIGNIEAFNSIYFIDQNKGWAVGGSIGGTGSVIYYGTIAKTNNGGVTSANENLIDKSNLNFYLSQNYPNPFSATGRSASGGNPSTTICWQSPVGSWQTIKLYNSLGEEIDTIVDGYYEAVKHSTFYIINSTLPSGVYFYRWQAADYIETKKIVLVR